MRKNVEWSDFEEANGVPTIWDPAYQRVVYDELPTLSIKKHVRRLDAITTENIASAYFGSGSVMRITRLHLETRSIDAWFHLKDQSGTIDSFFLQNAPAGSYMQNITNVNKHGGPKNPLYTARGNFQIYHGGSLSAGTIIAAFEGYAHNSEVGFAHRARR